MSETGTAGSTLASRRLTAVPLVFALLGCSHGQAPVRRPDRCGSVRRRLPYQVQGMALANGSPTVRSSACECHGERRRAETSLVHAPQPEGHLILFRRDPATWCGTPEPETRGMTAGAAAEAKARLSIVGTLAR